MSQTDPPADPNQGNLLTAAQEQNKQVMKAFGKLFESITPWLVEFGSWIFGGLIAFTLLIMASLLTIGPVDPAIKVATAAFALALPLNVTGLFMLRLVQDLKQVGFEEEVAQAFQDINFPGGQQITTTKTLESMRKRRAGVFLGYCLGILTLSGILTLTAITSAMWHMAWWIGVAFFAMIIISPVIVIVAFVSTQPPDTPEEKERKRRYRAEMAKQARAYQKKGERNF